MSNDIEMVRVIKLQTSINKMLMEGTRNPRLVADYLQRIIDPSLAPVEPALCRSGKDGIIHFSLIANGWTGRKWVGWCAKNKIGLPDALRFILLSESFRPTPAGTIIKVAVLTGGLFHEYNRTISDARDMGEHYGLKKPNMDVSCLILRMLTWNEAKAMNLREVVIMHELVDDSVGVQWLLRVYWTKFGNPLLGGIFPRSFTDSKSRDKLCGFAFEEVPQR